MNPACSALLGCNGGLLPLFLQILSEYRVTSLHLPLRVSLIFYIGMQVRKPKKVKRTRNTSTSGTTWLCMVPWGTESPWDVPPLHQQRGEQPDSSSSSLQGLGALSSPGLHTGLLELLTSFSGFSKSLIARTGPHGLKPPFPSAAMAPLTLCSHQQSCSVSCPLFLILCGQFTIYSHSFEDFALPYRDLFHKPHTHPAQMLPMPPSQASQLPWQCLGHVHALKQAVYCWDRSIFLFRNPLFSLTIAF